MSTLREVFAGVPDHRRHKGLYSLESLLLLVVAGFMCGCNSLASVARFAQSLTDGQREALGFAWFRHKVPSHPTLCIFFHDLNVGALEKGLCSRLPEGTAVALDGKRLRGSVSQEAPQGVHLLSCFASALRQVVGQTRQKEGNEVTAALELLGSLDLKDIIVTGDAMFAHRELCQVIRGKGGHYVFTLKDNQKSMKQAVERAFSHTAPRRRKS